MAAHYHPVMIPTPTSPPSASDQSVIAQLGSNVTALTNLVVTALNIVGSVQTLQAQVILLNQQVSVLLARDHV